MRTMKAILLTLLKLVEAMSIFFNTTKEDKRENQTRNLTEGEEDHSERDPDGD